MSDLIKWVEGESIVGKKITIEMPLVAKKHESTDKKYSHIGLYKHLKGAGNFKSGVIVGKDDKGNRVSVMIDVRLLPPLEDKVDTNNPLKML